MNTDKDNIGLVLVGDQNYLFIDDNFYKVYKLEKDTVMEKDTAYVSDEWYPYAKVYRGIFKNTSKLPGLYTKGNSLVEIEPSPEDKEKYHISNINNLELSSIVKRITTTTSVTPELIKMRQANADQNCPPILLSDDILKKAIKAAVIKKGINLNNYKDKFDNAYDLNNLKAALSKNSEELGEKGMLSLKYFLRFLEILGLEATLILRDNGTDKLFPMDGEVVIDEKFNVQLLKGEKENE